MVYEALPIVASFTVTVIVGVVSVSANIAVKAVSLVTVTVLGFSILPSFHVRNLYPSFAVAVNIAVLPSMVYEALPIVASFTVTVIVGVVTASVNIATNAVSLVTVTVLGFSVLPSFQPVNS